MSSIASFPATMRVEPAARRLRIALVYGRMPLPMTHADQLTVAHLIAFLSERGHTVDLFTLDNGEAISSEQRRWLELRCGRVVTFPQGPLRSVISLVRALLRGLPLQVGWFLNGRQIRAVRRAIDDGGYDIAYAYYIRSAEALRGLCPAGASPLPGRPATFLAMQLSQALNTRRIAENAARARDKMIYSVEQKLVHAYEARIWCDFSRTVLISRRDLDEVQAACREQGVPEIDNFILCAHGVDIDRFRPRPEISPEPATLVFSGVMKTNTNINAITWFVRECWPAIKAAVPAARLIVVGRAPAPQVVALGDEDASITVTGEVPDPAEFIARATVCINPMQAGAGMQNKLIEYLASGKAVVATPVANEGIGATPEEHLVIAASADDFAEAVVNLLRNRERREALGASARAYVEHQWTWEKHFLDLEAAMLAACGIEPPVNAPERNMRRIQSSVVEMRNR